MMPRIVVTTKPLGLFGPGDKNFAITPAMKPMMIVHRMLMEELLIGSDHQRRTIRSVRRLLTSVSARNDTGAPAFIGRPAPQERLFMAQALTERVFGGEPNL